MNKIDKMIYYYSNIKISDALNLLRLSDEEGHLSAQLLELLHAHCHQHFLVLCSLDLNHYFWAQNFVKVVG